MNEAEDKGYQKGYAFGEKIGSHPLLQSVAHSLQRLLGGNTPSIPKLFFEARQANEFGLFAHTNPSEFNYFFGINGSLREFKKYFVIRQWPNHLPPALSLSPLDRAILWNPQWRLYREEHTPTPFFLFFTPEKNYAPLLLSEAYRARKQNRKGIDQAHRDLLLLCRKCLNGAPPYGD